MSDSLKSKTVSGLGWSAIERFSVQGVAFLVQIILARLLLPADYGAIAILVVFLQIAQVFIDSGFANALIKKIECTEDDYATVFWYNLAVSVIIYIILFLCAPLISDFYNNEALTSVLRVIAFTLVLNALSIVQKTRLVKIVDFKSQSKVTLSSSLISGAIGILLAYCGYGVWALVAQYVSNSLLQFVLYLTVTKWVPSFSWSGPSFKYVFDFGSKLLTANLIGVVYKNLYSLVVGKCYSTQELGYFSRADQFASFPSNNIGNIISRVSFPIFSAIQDQDTRLLSAYRKLIKCSSFIIFPLMYGLMALSEPFVVTVLTDKWLPCVILLQILCVDWSIDHISLLNLNLLYVKGRTDLVLKLEVIKKTVAVIILLVTLPMGLVYMCYGRVLYSIFAIILNTYYTKRILNFGLKDQIRDFLPYMVVAIIMAVIIKFSISLIPTPGMQLLVGFFVGVIVYLILSLCFFRSVLSELLLLIKR